MTVPPGGEAVGYQLWGGGRVGAEGPQGWGAARLPEWRGRAECELRLSLRAWPGVLRGRGAPSLTHASSLMASDPLGRYGVRLADRLWKLTPGHDK